MSHAAWLRLLILSALLVALAFAAPGWTQAKAGKKYALLVGVTQYDSDVFRPLKYTENDVDRLAEILRDKGGFDVVRVLSHTRGRKDKKDMPTAANVKKAIEELLEGKKRGDTVLLALSGHGATVSVDDPDEKGKAKTFPFFCPSDADLRGISYSTGRSKTLVNLDELFDQLKTCGAGSKLVLVDACRNEMKADSATRNLDVDKVSVPRGVAAMFSCSEDEVAWESAKLKHGVFFHFVLEGLRGRAKNDDGEVTWDGLAAYVRKQVAAQVGKIVGGGARQTPHSLGNVRGAPPVLAVVEQGKGGGKDGGGKAVVEKDGGPPAKIKNSLGMELVLIPKGKFMMGSTKQERDAVLKAFTDANTRKHIAAVLAKETQHEVEIAKPFYLGVYEVTQKQYTAVMGSNPSWFCKDGNGKDKVKGMDTDDFPVEQVSWDDAQEFIKTLNALVAERNMGRVYRLPTEAEWEYACRGGAKESTPYHFGKTISLKLANVGGGGGGLDRTCKVGSYKPNGFGLCDMHGNVAEWCADYFGEDYYANKEKTDPQGPKDGKGRVIRGGSWYENIYGERSTGQIPWCRSAHRAGHEPDGRMWFFGFRVVCVAPTKD